PFRLRFEIGASRALRSGTKVKVVGRSLGSEVYVAGCCDTSSSTSSSPNLQTVSQAQSITNGDQRTLVMVANFGDAVVSCSTDCINDLVFAAPTGTFDLSGTGLS